MLHKTERYILAISVCGALLFNALPYLYQFQHTPPDLTYIGAYPIPFDKPTYLAEMQQGREGAWKIINRYSHEPQKPVFLYSFYTTLGHVAGIFHLANETIFLFARFFFGLLLIGAIVWTVRSFIPVSQYRILAYLLVFFGSGLGWLPGAPARAPDVWIPDFLPMIRFSHFPHMMTANALLLVCVVLLTKSFSSFRVHHALIAGLCAGLLAIVLPFHFLILYPLAAVIGILHIRREKKLTQSLLIRALIFLALSLPPFLFQLSIGLTDPFWRAVEQANILPMPPLISVIFGLGTVLIFFIAGTHRMIRALKEKGLLIVSWVWMALIFSYIIPLPIHRRFIETALFVPLSIGAAFGVVRFFSWFQSQKSWLLQSSYRMASVVIIAILLLGSNVQSWNAFKEKIDATSDPRIFVRAPLVEGLLWLGKHTKGQDVVFSSYFVGNLIPPYANRTVFIGHGPLTLDLATKSALKWQFFSRTLSADDARALLASIPASFVVESYLERSPYLPPLTADYPFLEPVFANDAVTIYHRR